MQWSEIQFNPPQRTLRQFAGLWMVFFAGLAAWQGLLRGHVWLGVSLAILAVTLGPFGLFKPQSMRWIYVSWIIVAFPVGWTVSRIALGLLFYGVFTPVGLFLKLKGRDPLRRRPCPNEESYWTTKPMPTNVRRYFDQS
jgi:Saxitoxin biosynthesis operon protein SxtJ